MINKTQIMLIALTLLIAGTGNLYAQDKQDAQAVASSEKKATLKASFPFVNLQGAIILEVYINDYPKPLKLLFDTGADGMAIHEELAKELNLEITRTNKASVVGGFQDINVSDHNQVRIGDLKLQEMGIAIFPSKKAEGIDGLIGNTLLKRYITAIDYQSNIIRVYSPGNIEYPKEGNLLPIDDSTGLLRIPATLEIVPNQNHSGSFVFDTGASYNVICFRPFVRKNRLLVSGFKPDGQSSTVSFGIFSPTFYGRSASFKLQGQEAIPDFPVTLMAGSSNDNVWNPTEAGSIGNRLISRYNILINLPAKEMHLQPNSLSKLPFDINIKSIQFGWNQQGQLSILAAPPHPEINKKIGVPIQSLRNVSVEELIRNPEKLAELIKHAPEDDLLIQFADNTELTL